MAKGSSNPLSMTAISRRKDADPLRDIRDGKKQKVKGQANVPTARQKQGALELALSGVGGPIAGKLLGKAAGALARGAASKTASNVGKRMTGANRRRASRRAAANKSKETPNTATSPTSAPMPKKPVTPRVNKPKTPKPETPKKPTSGTPRTSVANIGRVSRGEQTRQAGKFRAPTGVEKVVGGTGRAIRENPGKTAALAGLTAANIGVGKALYDSIDPMPNNKKVDTATAPVNKEPTVNKMSDYELADDTNIKSPRKMSDYELADDTNIRSPRKAAPEDEFYKFYGKEGTGLGDFSRKFGIQYATQKGFERDFPEHDGEQMGGRPGKSKMKTQGLNRSKRTGFSGRGAGAALRGF